MEGEEQKTVHWSTFTLSSKHCCLLTTLSIVTNFKGGGCVRFAFSGFDSPGLSSEGESTKDVEVAAVDVAVVSGARLVRTTLRITSKSVMSKIQVKLVASSMYSRSENPV